MAEKRLDIKVAVSGAERAAGQVSKLRGEFDKVSRSANTAGRSSARAAAESIQATKTESVISKIAAGRYAEKLSGVSGAFGIGGRTMMMAAGAFAFDSAMRRAADVMNDDDPYGSLGDMMGGVPILGLPQYVGMKGIRAEQAAAAKRSSQVRQMVDARMKRDEMIASLREIRKELEISARAGTDYAGTLFDIDQAYKQQIKSMRELGELTGESTINAEQGALEKRNRAAGNLRDQLLDNLRRAGLTSAGGAALDWQKRVADVERLLADMRRQGDTEGTALARKELERLRGAGPLGLLNEATTPRAATLQSVAGFGEVGLDGVRISDSRNAETNKLLAAILEQQRKLNAEFEQANRRASEQPRIMLESF